VGGDLSLPRLLDAYRQGIFPWYSEGEPIHWWNPNPRAVMDIEHLHISRSLTRTLRRGEFRISWNQDFRRVMEACGSDREEGTWIFPEMVEAYCAAHLAGHAHSIEVWRDGELAGGLYGFAVGAAFMAESMFHRVTDASKVALASAIQTLFAAGVELFDVQFLTAHLKSMGAYTVRRSQYLERLASARIKPLDLCRHLAAPRPA
jgi:leucyl/phenylalanyl-tRNA--protein transferase